MTNAILVVGLAWWFGGTYFGTRHRLRKAGGAGSLLGSAPRGVLYVAAAAASFSMIALALSASTRIAAADSGFGPFVFGAILCSMVAGFTLGTARA